MKGVNGIYTHTPKYSIYIELENHVHGHVHILIHSRKITVVFLAGDRRPAYPHLPQLEPDVRASRTPLGDLGVLLVVGVGHHRVLPLALVVRVGDHLRLPLALVFGVLDRGRLPLAVLLVVPVVGLFGLDEKNIDNFETIRQILLRMTTSNKKKTRQF